MKKMCLILNYNNNVNKSIKANLLSYYTSESKH